MRYRLTIVTVIVTVVAAAGIFLTVTNGDDTSAERDQSPPEVITPRLGIVAAFTATAEAGGPALDPTALVTPTVESDVLSATSTSAPGIAARDPDQTFEPLLSNTSGSVSPGQAVSLQLTGAAPGEQFEVQIDGEPVIDSGKVDAAGTAAITVDIPDGLAPGSVEISFSGTISGSTAISIDISVSAPSVTYSPSGLAAGDSITISAEGFGPAEVVSIRISGQIVGSAVAGNDGRFSITTRLPELVNGAHGISLEGESGELATAELTIGSTGDTSIAVPTATPSATESQAGDSEQSDTSGGPEGGSPDGTQDETPDGAGQSQDSPQSAVGAPVSDQQSKSPSDATNSPLPVWLYVVIGSFAGWLGLLTIWVVRLDRRRDMHSEELAREIVRLLAPGRAEIHPDQQGDSAEPADDEQAA